MSETQNETPHKEEPNPQNESPVKSAVEKNSEVQNSHQRKDSEPNKDVISLFNFDPNCKDVYFLTSPRSKEAVRRLGFEESELLMKKKEDFINDALPEDFANERDYYAELKLEHYELRRQEKVKMCIEERNRIINKLNRGSHSVNASLTNYSERYSMEKSFLEGDRKKVEQMKNKQKKEIEYIISNEMRIQEIQRRNFEKMRKMREMEMKREEEIKAKQALSEQEKYMRDKKKYERDQKMEEINREILEKKRQDEIKRREKQERLQKEREQEAKRKEEERKMKAETLDKKIKALQAQRLEVAVTRMKVMEEKAEKMRQTMSEMQFKKQIESEQTRLEFEEKRRAAKENYERTLEEQRQRFEERQREIAEKLERSEAEKRQEMDLRRARSEQRIKEIKETLETRFQEEQKRKENYTEKIEIAERNKRRIEEELERRRNEKIRETIMKEQKMRETLKERGRLQEEKKSVLASTITEGIRKADTRKEENLREVQRKYLMEILRAQDAEENLKRLEKVQNMKVQSFLERMSVEEERLQRVQREKEEQTRERRRLQGLLEKEKAQILQDFERKKRRLRDGQQLDKSEWEMFTETNTSHINSRTLNPANESQKPVKSRQTSSNRTLPTPLPKETAQKKEIKISTSKPVAKSVIIKSQSLPNTRKNIPVLGLATATHKSKAEPIRKLPQEQIKKVAQEPKKKANPEPVVETPNLGESDILEIFSQEYENSLRQARAQKLQALINAIAEEGTKYQDNQSEKSLRVSSLTIVKLTREHQADYEKIRRETNAYKLYSDL